MDLSYRALTEGEITEALSYLPGKHKDLVKSHVRTYNVRRKNRKNQVIEGSYLVSNGHVLVYAFSPREILRKRYLNTVWHETGHKVFQETLTRVEKACWGNIREQEEFILDLSDLYTVRDLWEEEFCFTYQMLIRLDFYTANKMKIKKNKLKKFLDGVPKRKIFVQKIITQASDNDFENLDRKNCLKIAQDRLEKIIGPLI